jgi:hypothetical protein
MSVEANVRYSRAIMALAMVLLAAACTSSAAAKTAPSAGALLCPQQLPASVPKHQRPGTPARVVPGHPVTLLGCRYYGLNLPQPRGTLAQWVRVNPGPAASFINSFREANPMQISCPDDNGSAVLLDFGYPDESDLVVRINTSGCGYATNGDRTVQAQRIWPYLGQVLGSDWPIQSGSS